MSPHYKRISSILLAAATCIQLNLYAESSGTRQTLEEHRRGTGYILRDGKILDARDAPSQTMQEHYGTGVEALKNRNWKEVIKQFRIVAANWPETTFGQDSSFYLALGYFNVNQAALAERQVAKYLALPGSLKYFEEAYTLKLAIADKYSRGTKKHLFGIDKLPTCISAKKDALRIYDEVITALPNHPIAAKAYLAKGDMLRRRKEYRESIDAYQQVIKKFPKDESAPIAFISIAKTYDIQSKREHQNPDILALAEVNAKRFEDLFPRDERLAVVQSKLRSMEEVYAQSLYETGRFYERIKQPQASVIYYSCALRRYPDTQIARECKERLTDLNEVACKLELSRERSL